MTHFLVLVLYLAAFLLWFSTLITGGRSRQYLPAWTAAVGVAVHVAALGRFTHLLARSLPFLLGSLASAPLALLFWPGRFDLAFLALYALTLLGVAMLHLGSLKRLARA